MKQLTPRMLGTESPVSPANLEKGTQNCKLLTSRGPFGKKIVLNHVNQVMDFVIEGVNIVTKLCILFGFQGSHFRLKIHNLVFKICNLVYEDLVHKSHGCLLYTSPSPRDRG